MEIIAHFKSDLPEKFGLPRQSHLAPHLMGKIIFDEKYSDPQAFEGLEGYERIWVLWKFDVPEDKEFRPQVRPPRLGGNTYVGVFATRSPFRPNHIGMSCVKIERIDLSGSEAVIEVSGADMMDGTSIYDIKPYLPYADSYPDVKGGFAQEAEESFEKLKVIIPKELEGSIPEDKFEGLKEILSLDPRPSYHDDPVRVYGLAFAGLNIKFNVSDGCIRIVEVK